MIMNIHNEKNFELVVADIFKYCGYKVELEYQINNYHIDIKAELNNKIYMIETKYSRTNKIDSIKLKAICEQLKNCLIGKSSSILVTCTKINDKFKDYILDQFNIQILDISNLLYMIQNNNVLYNRLLSIIDFSINDIIPQKPNIEIHFFNIDINFENKFENKIYNIKPCKEEAYLYSNTCIDILKYLFIDELSIWQKEQHSNNDLYRFDLICKIKNNLNDEFFETLQKFFNTKYIIFEFKNYSEKITQREIYTTEKYLYKKALRSVAIIISRYGFDNNALIASKGCLRENGKLLINVTYVYLINMIKKKDNHENPSDYLSELLDTMLIELE